MIGARTARSDTATGALLVAVSASSFGAMPLFARAAYDGGAEPVSLLFLRFLVAGLTLLAIMRARGIALPAREHVRPLALMGGIGYVGQSMCYFTALTMAPAGLVALLLYLYPALVTVLAALLLGERLTRPRVVALAAATAGSALTVGPALGGRPLGIVLGASAALIYAVYILVGSRVTPRTGAIPSSAVIMLAAAAVYAALVVITRPTFPATLAGWAGVAGIAIVGTVVAIVTFFAGMEKVGPASASTLSTLEPAVTVALAAVFLDETITAVQAVGGALIVAAVVALARLPAPGSGRAAPAE